MDKAETAASPQPPPRKNGAVPSPPIPPEAGDTAYPAYSYNH